MSRVRNTARVTPAKAVPNKVPRRRATKKVAPPLPEVTEEVVHPVLLDAAKATMRPGERLRLVSRTEVWTVARR